MASGKQSKKIRQMTRRNLIRDYRAFCDFINAQKFFRRVRFALHVLAGRL